MKKIYQLATIFVLLASFGVPILVSADTNTNCYSYNSAGEYIEAVSGTSCTSNGKSGNCDSTGSCVTTTNTSSYTTNSYTSSKGIDLTWVNAYGSSIKSIVNSVLVPAIIAIAFIVFLFGIFKYFIYGATNESEKAEGRTFAMWGIIGFVIIVSVWGLVNIVKSTLIPSGASSTAPNYPTL